MPLFTKYEVAQLLVSSISHNNLIYDGDFSFLAREKSCSGETRCGAISFGTLDHAMQSGNGDESINCIDDLYLQIPAHRRIREHHFPPASHRLDSRH